MSYSNYQKTLPSMLDNNGFVHNVSTLSGDMVNQDKDRLPRLDISYVSETISNRIGRVGVIPCFHPHLRLSIFGYGSIALSFLILKLSLKSHKREI